MDVPSRKIFGPKNIFWCDDMIQSVAQSEHLYFIIIYKLATQHFQLIYKKITRRKWDHARDKFINTIAKQLNAVRSYTSKASCIKLMLS